VAVAGANSDDYNDHHDHDHDHLDDDHDVAGGRGVEQP
jgi:hypothetical protein